MFAPKIFYVPIEFKIWNFPVWYYCMCRFRKWRELPIQPSRSTRTRSRFWVCLPNSCFACNSSTQRWISVFPTDLNSSPYIPSYWTTINMYYHHSIETYTYFCYATKRVWGHVCPQKSLCSQLAKGLKLSTMGYRNPRFRKWRDLHIETSRSTRTRSRFWVCWPNSCFASNSSTQHWISIFPTDLNSSPYIPSYSSTFPL